MKLVKSLLLGAAAGVVGVASAQAADLPSRSKGPAVEYVKICDAYGSGYFYIPGTDTCLKVGGQVRAEYQFQNTRNGIVPGGVSGKDQFGNNYTTKGVADMGHDKNNALFHTRVEAREETRTQTQWGVLRTVGYLEIDNSANNTSSSIDKAYINWAGITAGYVTSMFDFYADDAGYSGIRTSDNTTNVLAYTYAGPGGLSLTGSAEDPTKRRYGVVGPVPGTAYSTSVGNGGTRFPDFVGNVRLDQGWGSAQFSGAAHQTNMENAPGFVTTNGVLTDSQSHALWGYAFQGGVKIKLPMLAPGDNLWVQGAYGSGALDYVLGGAGSTAVGGFSGPAAAGIVQQHGDFFVWRDSTGQFRTSREKAYSALAALEHYWTPQIRQDVYGGYAQVKPGSGTNNGDWANGYLSDWRELRIGSMLQWTPVSGLNIGVDGMYARVNQKLAHDNWQNPTNTTINGVAFKRNYDSYSGRLRIERVF